MQKLSNRTLGIDQGTTMLFSDFENDGPMWTGTGQREIRKHIPFKEAFQSAPAVIVGLSLWDSDTRANLRADLGAENVTREGFDLVFRTWGDSRIARIRADWTALGAARDGDDWDL